jgi:hypothetical protein
MRSHILHTSAHEGNNNFLHGANFKTLQGSMLILGLILFGVSILTNVQLYSSFSDDTLHKSTFFGMGLAFDLSKLLLSLAIGALFYTFCAYILASIAFIFWLALTLISIMSAFGFMTVVNNAMESKALVSSSAFKSAENAVEKAQIRVDSLSIHANPTQATQATSQINRLSTELQTLWNSPATNSINQRTGKSVRTMLNSCPGKSFYHRKYCLKINKLENKIVQSKDLINGHTEYLGAVAAKEARLKEMSAMNVQNAGITNHVHPMFIGLAAIRGRSADYVKYEFLIASAIICELLGSFMLVLYSRLKRSIPNMPNTHINIDYAQNENNNLPLRVKSDMDVFTTLCKEIQAGTIKNLSYKSLGEWGQKRGLKLSQIELKSLRNRLNEDKIAIYDKTKQLVIV